jgi:outer membrane receptor protein involved in Fe transport
MHVTRRLRATGALLAAVFLYGTAAFADTVFIGTVVNAVDQKPVPDVVVTVRSPNLIGDRTVVTDAKGEYRIPQLAPGAYTLYYEAADFQPNERKGITLRLDQTLRVNVQLVPGFTESVEVVGQAPTVDVGSTTTGARVDQDFIRRIAVSAPGGRGGTTRSFESLAELAPGAQNDTYGVSINGATSPENGYVVDGVSVNDPAFGINSSPLSVEFVEDVNIITGGYLPEFGRATGGVVNAVTKSGSNEFHGSVWGNWVPGLLQGTPAIVSDLNSAINGQNRIDNVGDLGASLGGPIMKDKLWFFAGLAPSLNRSKHIRSLNAFNAVERDGKLIAGDPTIIDGTQQEFFAESRNLQYMGKLTYLINQDHNISLAANGTINGQGGQGLLSSNARVFLPDYMNGSPDWYQSYVYNSNLLSVGAKYSGAFLQKKVLVDANVGFVGIQNSQLPSDGTQLGTAEGLAGRARVRYRSRDRSLAELEVIPGNACDAAGGLTAAQRCPSVNYDSGGPGQIYDQTLTRLQANAKVTYLLDLLGKHLIKAGVDGELTSYDQLKAYTGGAYLRESTDGATWQDYRRYGYLLGPDTQGSNVVVPQAFQRSFTRSDTLGGFLQDSWTVADRVTLNLGLRYDAQFLYGGAGSVSMLLPNQLSPRLGVIVDPLANGRMKLFGSFARYYEQVPLNMMDRAFPGENRYSVTRYARSATRPNGCDPSTLEGQRECLDPANVAVLRPRSNSDLGLVNPNRYYTGGKVENQPVDPNILPQSSDEFVAGAEFEVISNTRLGANYIRRYMNAVIEDMSRDDGNTYFLGNPGRGFAKDFPNAVRDYDAFILFVSRNFADGWLAQVNYTLSFLRGNYPGLFRPENGQLDPNILSDFDLISLLPNRSGPLPYDRTHQIKAFVAREFRFAPNLSTSLGLSYRGNSGAPINFIGGHPAYGQSEAFLLPRGAGGRGPWVNAVDTNLNVTYNFSRESAVTFTVDVFNLFNFQSAERLDSNYTLESVLPVVDGRPTDLPGSITVIDANTEEPRAWDPATDPTPNSRRPPAYQQPRQFRFGVRYSF